MRELQVSSNHRAKAVEISGSIQKMNQILLKQSSQQSFVVTLKQSMKY